MSKLLINETPLTVQPSLVKIVGLGKAVILQQVHYACQQPKSGIRLSDGHQYVWNTYQDWHDDYFPFWQPENIQKHFLALEKEGYLISCQPYLSSGNATKYYRVNQELIEHTHHQQKLMMGSTKVNDGVNESKPSLKEQRILTKTSTKNTSSGKTEIPVNSDFIKKTADVIQWIQELQNTPILAYEEDYPDLIDQFLSKITPQEFQEYYLWLYKNPKLKHITPKTIKNQYQAFTNREVYEQKDKNNGAKTNGNNQNRKDKSAGNNSGTSQEFLDSIGAKPAAIL